MFEVGQKVRRVRETSSIGNPLMVVGGEYIVKGVTEKGAYCVLAGLLGWWETSSFEVSEVVSSLAKDTNPKEAAGASRLPLHLIPDGPLALISLAHYEGAVKYGAYNWREAGVRASTYVAACRRHLSKWWNGDDTDPVSKVHHLANAAACLIITMDAEIQGMLNDDRPTKQNLQELYDALAATQLHLYNTLTPKEADANVLQKPRPDGTGVIPGTLPRHSNRCANCAYTSGPCLQCYNSGKD